MNQNCNKSHRLVRKEQKRRVSSNEQKMNPLLNSAKE